jgi:predicted Zn finger-like uncharacterized protein
MRVFCHTCQRSFPVTDKEIVADNGSELAVIKCSTCHIMYLAIESGKTAQPQLLKLTKTKSFIIDKQNTAPSIIQTPERLVITPAEAAEMIRRQRGR